MNTYLLLIFAIFLNACSSTPNRTGTQAKYDWTWTKGISVSDFNSEKAKLGRKLSWHNTPIPPDHNPPKSKLAKAFLFTGVTYDRDTTYNNFNYKKGLTYWGLRTYVESKDGQYPFVVLPQYEDIKILSVQEVYLKEHGATSYQVMNLDTGEITPSDIKEVRTYNHQYGNGKQGISKIFLVTDKNEVIFTHDGKKHSKVTNFDSEIQTPFRIPALLSIKDHWSNKNRFESKEISIAIRHKESNRKYYQLYSARGEKIGEPIDLKRVKHLYTSTMDEHREHWESSVGRKLYQTIKILVKVNDKDDLYMPLGQNGIVSHPKVLGLRPLTVDVSTLPPEQIKEDFSFDYLWSHTAIKWEAIEFPNGAKAYGWGLYSGPVYEQDMLSRIHTLETGKDSDGYREYFKTFKPITIDILSEDKTALTTRLAPVSAYIVDSLDIKTELSLLIPYWILGKRQWPLEKYGNEFSSEKELKIAMAKRDADLLKQKATSEAAMKSIAIQRKKQHEMSQRQKAQQQENRQAYYNSIIQNGPRAKDLSTFQYEVAIYCQARRDARCTQYKAQARNWQNTHNQAYEENNRRRIQNYMNPSSSNGNSGWQGFTYTEQTTNSFKKTDQEWKERKELNEFKRNLDHKIKSKGR